MTVSASTKDRLIVDAGTVTVGADDIGASRGGCEFWCEVTFIDPKFDGVRGPLKQAVWISVLVPKMKVFLTEIQLAKVQWCFAGASLASDVSSEVLTHTPGLLVATDYRDCIFIGTKSDGETIVITISDAVVKDQVTLSFTDEDTTIYEVVFSGHYDAATPTTAPYSIVNTIA